MTNYIPDNWVILKIGGNTPHYRVLGGWIGGYLNGNSWRLNSGIKRHDFDGDYWNFYGSSGSCYDCHIDSYHMNSLMADVYEHLKSVFGDEVKVLEDQEWTKENWDWIL
jgi:hypothetical protein